MPLRHDAITLPPQLRQPADTPPMATALPPRRCRHASFRCHAIVD